MDRRSWLWRKKSSEKSPGETESSGSISSHSERFSDEQGYPINSTQSPEVTSKAASNVEEVNESVKTLTEKLSAALRNISAKEELVKQHAKVAEEAVSGWEKAENEVLGLKKKLEAVAHKNSALEDRLGYLDGALKECMRQLRQAREEQEENISAIIARKTHEWESVKTDLESQLVELQTQLQGAKTENATSNGSDLQLKLEASHKEIVGLKNELLSQAKELKIKTIERELSTKSAENASKQHLESIKKVAKLEAECRILKAIARKASQANDQKSISASSVYLESSNDYQSDSGKRLYAVEFDIDKTNNIEANGCGQSQSDSAELQLQNEKVIGRNQMVPSVEINLMDDFLEMEKLAALPNTESGSHCIEVGPVYDKPDNVESPLKAELEAMIQRTAELEEKLEKIGSEKMELEMALTECQMNLETSQALLSEAEIKLKELQKQLVHAREAKLAAEEELMTSKTKREEADTQLGFVKTEVKSLLLKIDSLEEEFQKERALSADNAARCEELQNELLSMKNEAEMQRLAELQRLASINGDLKAKQEQELVLAADKFAECQKTIASLGQKLTCLATLEDFLLDFEKPLQLAGEESMQLYENVVGEAWKLHSEKHSDATKAMNDWSYDSYSWKNGNEQTPALLLDPAYSSSKSSKSGT